MLSQKVIHKYHNWIKAYRKLFSIAPNIDELEKNKSKRKTDNVKLTVLETMKSFSDDYAVKSLMTSLPRSLLQRNSNPQALVYLINKEVSKTFSDMISKDLLKNSCHVIECNPGFGLLTNELLKIGVPKIILYESISLFETSGPLKRLLFEHKDKLTIRCLNFNNCWKLLLHDTHTMDNVADQFFVDLPTKAWKSEPYVQIILFHSDKFFVTMLIHNFFNQTRIFSHGRPAFYVVMPSVTWQKFQEDHKDPRKTRHYNYFNVMLHLFFDSKAYGELPRNTFIPWPSETKQRFLTNSPMVAIKIEPKINTFDLIDKDDLRHFWFYLKHCMRSKKTRVIQEFELMIPGCGSRLIQFNIHICTTFKDLSPEEHLEIFKEFRSWPEYDSNLFITQSDIIEEVKKEEEETKVELNPIGESMELGNDSTEEDKER